MWDTDNGIVDVQLQSDGKAKKFKLAEEIEYLDSDGNVATAEVFTAGDTVLIVEDEGTITKITKKNRAENSKQPASNDNAADKAKADEDFLQMLNQIDMGEVKIGKIAEENAANEAVKKFGERMVLDHSSMNEDLRKLASKKGIALDEGLESTQQELLDQLSTLKGAEFDHVYTKDMVAGHEKAIARFEKAAKTSSDPDVNAWAEKWLPTLKEHLALAKETVDFVQGE